MRNWLLCNLMPGFYINMDVRLPRVDAIANKSLVVKGQRNCRPFMNSFDAPNTVAPKPAIVKLQRGKLTLNVERKSVTVISIEE